VIGESLTEELEHIKVLGRKRFFLAIREIQIAIASEKKALGLVSF